MHLEALAQADKRVKLLIAGPPDSPDESACLRAAGTIWIGR